jgi:hypothetical protein
LYIIYIIYQYFHNTAGTQPTGPQTTARLLFPVSSATLECAVNSVVTTCNPHFSPADPKDSLIVYESEPYLGRVCLPVRKDFLENASLEAGVKDYA